MTSRELRDSPVPSAPEAAQGRSPSSDIGNIPGNERPVKAGQIDAAAFSMFRSKWALSVAWMLRGRTVRFGELRRENGLISQKMLSNSLKLLEHHGLVERRHYPTIPPRVEYNLSPIGEQVVALFVPLAEVATEARSQAASRRR